MYGDNIKEHSLREIIKKKLQRGSQLLTRAEKEYLEGRTITLTMQDHKNIDKAYSEKSWSKNCDICNRYCERKLDIEDGTDEIIYRHRDCEEKMAKVGL